MVGIISPASASDVFYVYLVPGGLGLLGQGTACAQMLQWYIAGHRFSIWRSEGHEFKGGKPGNRGYQLEFL